MPEIWKKLTPAIRHQLVKKIDELYEDSEGTGADVWGKKENILALTYFVPLSEIPKLRCCYLASKKDDSVMDRTAEYLVNLDEDEEEEDDDDDDEEVEINRDASVDKDQMKSSDVND